MLLVLLGAEQAARQREDQRIVALKLAQLAGDFGVVRQLVVRKGGARNDVSTHASTNFLSAGHRRSRADGLGRPRDLALEHLQRVVVDLREGGKRLDRVDPYVERGVRTDRERGLLQPLTRLRAQRVCAGQALAVAEQRQKAVLFG